jgi:ribosome biogenesis GTPase
MSAAGSSVNADVVHYSQHGINTMNLEMLGWSPFFSTHFDAAYAGRGYIAGRVALEHRNVLELQTELGEIPAEVSGRLRHHARSRADLPAVGDWVALSRGDGDERGIIHGVLPRKSCFSRSAPGEAAGEQIVAANIDTVFLVTGLDGNYNLRRIERALILAWESGASPVVVLNKADLCDDLERRVAEVEAVALGVSVISVSAAEGRGIGQLEAYMAPGRTAALLGSSGVGKSTITNLLAGRDAQRTGEVSGSVGKGRHTTTRRELIVTPSGGLIIDTPGMRELGLWGDEESLRETFEDIESLAALCRFGDCRHQSEPGCAIRRGLEDGTLDPARLRNYQKMQRELLYLERRQDVNEALRVKREWKQRTKEQREHYRKR